MEELEARARRARRRTLLIVLTGLVAGGVLGWSFPHESATAHALQVVGWSLAVAGLGGAFSLMWTTTGLLAHLRLPLQSLSREASRSLRKSVNTGQPLLPLDSESAYRAFDYARIALVYQPLAWAQFLLLYAGIFGPQLSQLVDDDGFSVSFSRALCAVLVIVSVVFSVIWSRQLRGTRRYVRRATEMALHR